MDKVELKKLLAVAKNEYEKAKIELYRKYVADNAKYRAGDIITNGSKTILVKNVFYCENSFALSLISYKGYVLTRQLKKRKDGEIGYIGESDNVRKIE